MIHRRTSFSVNSVIVTLVLATAPLAAQPAGAATSMQFASNWQGSPSGGGVWVPSATSGNVLGAPEGFGSSLCVAASSSPGGATATFDFTGFSIPGGDLILGVEVRMKYQTSGDHDVQLTDGGSLVGSVRVIGPVGGTPNCDSTGWTAAGGPMDTWGATLTPAKFNSGDIGFKFNQRLITLSSGDPGSLTVDIDAVELIVYHGPANSPPTAEANGPYSVGEGGSVGLSSAGSADPDSNPLAFAWDLDNNGSFETPGASPAFSAAGRNGPTSQVVVLRVSDGIAAPVTDTATVTITNLSPSITSITALAASIDEGQSAVVTGTFTDPALALETHTGTAAWSDGPVTALAVGAGTFSTTRPFPDDNPTGTPADSFTVQIIINDGDGGSDFADSPLITVNNVAPSVNAPTVDIEPSDEGEAVVASADFTDPGIPDTFTCTVDYGEGDGSQPGTVTGNTCDGPSHTYGDNGSYTVEICVTDDDTGEGCNSSSHEVLNVPPTVDPPAVDIEPSNEGQEVVASADFTDPGFDDSPFTCTVDYGDGSAAQTGAVTGMTCTGPGYTYADNGSYTVEICVTDKDDGEGCESSPHEVLNVDPTITGSTNSAENCGETPDGTPVEISVDFEDPGFDSAVAGTLEDFDASEIDWGDGTVEPATIDETPGSAGTLTTGTASGSHTYATGGIYEIIVTIRDDDAGTDSTTLIALVTGIGLNGDELQVVGTLEADQVRIKRKWPNHHLRFVPGLATKPEPHIVVWAELPDPDYDEDSDSDSDSDCDSDSDGDSDSDSTSLHESFVNSEVASIRVLTCPGNDRVCVHRKVAQPAILETDSGHDLAKAGGGMSQAVGGPGDDRLVGGDNDDVLDGGYGRDDLKGGKGSDILLGGPDDDRLKGEKGDDLLDGGPGFDDCRGGAGTNIVVNCEKGDTDVDSDSDSDSDSD